MIMNESEENRKQFLCFNILTACELPRFNFR